jgi:hypothetical protein
MFGRPDLSGPILMHETNCIIINWEDPNDDSTLTVYNNNKLIITEDYFDFNGTDSESDIYLMTKSNNKEYCKGVLDELRFYDHILNETQRNEFYNSGAFTAGSLTGANPIGIYHFEENIGTTIANSANGGSDPMTLYNTPTWTTGLVLDTADSIGVYNWIFNKSEKQVLSVTLQSPHGFVIGVPWKPHVHWAPMDNSSGTVIWCLEYVATSVDSLINSTIIISTTSMSSTNVKDKHIRSDFDDIPTTNFTTVSTAIECSLYLSPNSTYEGDIAFKEFDVHIFRDQGGSRELYTK